MVLSNIIIPKYSDDYTGTESCMDLQNQNEFIDNNDSSESNNVKNKAKSKSYTKKKENKVFPPPIPLLARTQNLASHMPWVLKRYYTSEGRLILKEEKVKHHEYFHAHRANGRLTLQLVNVPLYDEYFEEATSNSPHDEEVDIDINVTHDHHIVGTSNDRFEDEDKDRFEDEDKDNMTTNIFDDEPVEHDNDVVDGSGRVKCLNYNSVRSVPTYIFGVPMRPIRTVHG